jgi:2',3'-cyclic-nucleotide 2'-phosphodiesterase/3'-nucleotidase
MKKTGYLFISLLVLAACTDRETVVRLAVTSDVHGMIFPYDFTGRKAAGNSLSHIYNYVSRERERKDTLLFLLDNGDLLQGQPTVYYFNFIDTTGEHLASRVMNYMGYAAGTVGNHDIETGPEVYNRIREEFAFPWLAANAVEQDTGRPCFEPYTILRAGRKRIAVLGLITPGIPHWLPKNLWPDLEFRDMVETAREWVPIIMKREHPDLLVGLFHSGTDAGYGGNPGPFLNENASLLVAEQVPGFQVIFAGHDHRESVQWVVNTLGDSVLVVDPGSHARYAGEVTVTFRPGSAPGLEARNVPMADFTPSAEFDAYFESDRAKVTAYLDDTITWLAGDMQPLDALFGPSNIISLIHEVQLDLSGSDLSFTAPLSLRESLQKGPLLVSDMFRLYHYENMLYTMELNGAEIDAFLEYAAGIWFNTMKHPCDHLLLFDSIRPGRLAHPYYNFSSAAGIDYTVDVTRPPGDRVNISGFSDGRDFREDGTYRVAVNSYRGSGGGGHLTRGAGIPEDELAGRIVRSTDLDLRFYLMQFLARQDTLEPPLCSNWRCIPEELIFGAARADRELIR